MNVNTDSELDFSKLEGLIAAVIQDSVSKEVLMVGFMNEQAFAQTLTTGFVVFYSRSRDKLWLKGESSGHTLQVVNLRTDCDRDALVIEVIANGPGFVTKDTQVVFLENDRAMNGQQRPKKHFHQTTYTEEHNDTQAWYSKGKPRKRDDRSLSSGGFPDHSQQQVIFPRN